MKTTKIAMLLGTTVLGLGAAFLMDTVTSQPANALCYIGPDGKPHCVHCPPGQICPAVVSPKQ